MAADLIHCPYCHQVAPLTESKQGRFIYLCEPCDAKVGCHPKSKRALGFPANKELRYWRRLAHTTFDPIWKDQTVVSRKLAYYWLSCRLHIHTDDCHIAQFTIRDCKKTVLVCLPILEKYIDL